MAQFNETPIFPGIVKNVQTTIASGSAATAVCASADATYSQVITGLVIYEKGSGGARTLRLELKNGSTVTVLKRFTTSGVQYTSTNLFTSTYIPGLDDTDPVLRLGKSDTLQLVAEDTNANALDITCFGATNGIPS